MREFWQFARMTLQYKGLLTLAACGALFDALCAFAGFASLMWIIEQLFNARTTAHDIIAEKLASPRLQYWVGDLTGLADLVPDDQWYGFATLLGLIFVLALLGTCGRFAHQYFAITVSLRTIAKIRRHAFQRLVHLPLALAGRDSTADNLSRVVRDCSQISRGFSALMNRAVRNILQGLVALAVALFVSWQLTLIFLIGVPVIAVAIRKFGKTINRAARRANRQFGHMLAALQESIQALPVVKVSQAEGYERRRFNRINRAVLREEMTARTARAMSSPVVEVIGLLGVVAVALVAAWWIYRTESGARPQHLIMVLAMLGVAAASFRPLANLNNDLQGAAAAALRVDQVLQLETEPNATGVDPAARPRRCPRHRARVTFDAVTFTYPAGDRPILRDIDLIVEQGRTCAIVGHNGSGKSTLVSLLPRLYEPDHGRILIDGVDIATCTLRSVRRQMAMVTQQTVLFEGTIAENLAYGARHVSRERVIAAARQAHAHEFIERLPEGYETEIGEAGGRLSGGQRQRIAIARAILRDPAILILDEATSQIDSDSEARIADALAEFMAARTTFVIAHRMSTVVNADLIVVMEDGRIASTGTHEQLLEQSDAYRVLCQTQLHRLPAPASSAGG